MTFTVDEPVRLCATLTNDTLMLFNKLTKGDMIAMESKYRPACLLASGRSGSC